MKHVDIGHQPDAATNWARRLNPILLATVAELGKSAQAWPGRSWGESYRIFMDI